MASWLSEIDVTGDLHKPFLAIKGVNSFSVDT